jgi:AcrR family transcriptional regulator
VRNASVIARAPSRGRPSAHLQRHVFDDLIRATEDALDQKNAHEITVREISNAAGTSEAMIRYYFGGKEGLLLELIKEFMEKSPHKDYEEVTNACIECRSVQPLVDRLCTFHLSSPNMVKMISVELFSSSSKLRELFLNKYGRCVNDVIEHVIDKLKEEKIYRADVNSTFVSMSLLRLIIAPIMESMVTGHPAVPQEGHSEEWTNFVAKTIDAISKPLPA